MDSSSEYTSRECYKDALDVTEAQSLPAEGAGRRREGAGPVMSSSAGAHTEMGQLIS